MKRIVLSTVVALFSLAVMGQTIEGNGKIVIKDVPVSSFDAIKAKGVYELRLTQGDKESVKIEADENLHQYFDVHNDGNKLVIGMKGTEKKNWKVKHKLQVHVTVKNLKELELSTVGGAVSENQLRIESLVMKNHSVGNVNLKLNLNKLELTNSSVGNVKLAGTAREAVVKNTGVGKLDASAFVVQVMDFENTGVGAAVVNAEKTLRVKDSFLGKVSNKGTAVARKMNRVRV